MNKEIKSLDKLKNEILLHYCRDFFSLFPGLGVGDNKKLLQNILEQFFKKGGIVTAKPDHCYYIRCTDKLLRISQGGINGEFLPCSPWQEIINEISLFIKQKKGIENIIRLGLELAQTGRRDRDELGRYETLIQGREDQEVTLLDTEDDESYKMRLADIPYMGNKSARLAEILVLTQYGLRNAQD